MPYPLPLAQPLQPIQPYYPKKQATPHPMEARLKVLGASSLMAITSTILTISMILDVSISLYYDFMGYTASSSFGFLGFYSLDLYLAVGFILSMLFSLPCIGFWLLNVNSKKTLNTPLLLNFSGISFLKAFYIICAGLYSGTLLILLPMNISDLSQMIQNGQIESNQLTLVPSTLLCIVSMVLAIAYYVLAIIYVDSIRKPTVKIASGRCARFLIAMNLTVAALLLLGLGTQSVMIGWMDQSLYEIIDTSWAFLNISLVSFIPPVINPFVIATILSEIALMISCSILILKYERTVNFKS